MVIRMKLLQATRLKIVLWIPVRVKDNDSVRRCEVDSNSARLGTDQERKSVAPSLTEPIDRALPTAGYRQ
jgi:hypothetical protein